MADFIVSNSNDSGEGSLRNAIALANTSAGTDRIIVEVDKVELQREIQISDSVEIEALEKATISQTGEYRLFTITNNDDDSQIDVALSNLNLTNANPIEENGGAIFSRENLSLNNVNIYRNKVTGLGGAIYSEGGSLRINSSELSKNNVDIEAEISAGGAIFHKGAGKLELIDSAVRENLALSDTITIVDSPSALISNTTIEDNIGSAVTVIGSEIEIKSSVINSNDTSFDGGGIFVDSSKAKIADTQISNNSGFYGGGVSVIAGYVELIDSSVTGNFAKADGGGLDIIDNSTLLVSGSTISDNSTSENNTAGISSFNAGANTADLSSKILVDKDSIVTDSVQENVEFVASLTEARMNLSEIHRFYQYEKGFHFYTADNNESNVIQEETAAGNLAYDYEGESFAALSANTDSLTGELIEGAEEVYRFFNSNTGAHLFTMDEVEKDYIESTLDNYSYEGVAYYAFEEQHEKIDTIPVYRMYNGQTDTHLLTVDNNEVDYIQENLSHFSLESNNGIAFYVMEV